MYYVVLCDNWCSALPANWVDLPTKSFYWPKKDKSVRSAIIKKRSPDETWLYKAYKKLMGPFDSYAIARKAEAEVENISTSDSALENVGSQLAVPAKRLIKKKVFSSSDDNVDQRSKQSSGKVKKASLPRPPTQYVVSTSALDKNSSSIQGLRSSTPERLTIVQDAVDEENFPSTQNLNDKHDAVGKYGKKVVWSRKSSRSEESKSLANNKKRTRISPSETQNNTPALLERDDLFSFHKQNDDISETDLSKNNFENLDGEIDRYNVEEHERGERPEDQPAHKTVIELNKNHQSQDHNVRLELDKSNIPNGNSDRTFEDENGIRETHDDIFTSKNARTEKSRQEIQNREKYSEETVELWKNQSIGGNLSTPERNSASFNELDLTRTEFGTNETPSLSRSSTGHTTDVLPNRKKHSESVEIMPGGNRCCDICHEMMKQLLKKTREILYSVNNSSVVATDVEDASTLLNLPLKTIEDFIDFEKLLRRDELARRQFKNKAVNVGGGTTQKFARNVVSLFIHDNLAYELTWVGQRQTRGISNTKFVKIIIAGIVNKIPGSTEHDVGNAIKDWLNHAGDRLRYKQKKQKQQGSEI